jgi:prephenate dehydrogenase
VAEVVPECWLTDVVSVKSPVLSSVRRLVPGARFAGGHPMAGSAESGWAAGSATLFGRAAWVVGLEDDTSIATWRVMAQLALDCGAGVVAATAAEHDDAVARISHLPHVLAAVLAAAGAEGGPLALALAAGSFADGTRVAGARPELSAAMCEGNRGPLLGALDDALGKLGVARGALASTGSLRSTLRAGNAARTALVHFRTGPKQSAEVDLAGPDVAERLRELGRLGGRIVRFDGDRAIAELPYESGIGSATISP